MSDRRKRLLEMAVELLAEWVRQADSGQIDGCDLSLVVSSEELLEELQDSEELQDE